MSLSTTTTMVELPDLQLAARSGVFTHDIYGNILPFPVLQEKSKAAKEIEAEHLAAAQLAHRQSFSKTPKQIAMEQEEEDFRREQSAKRLAAEAAQKKPEPRPLKSCLKKTPTPTSATFPQSTPPKHDTRHRRDSSGATGFSQTSDPSIFVYTGRDDPDAGYRSDASHHRGAQKPPVHRSYTYPIQAQNMPPYHHPHLPYYDPRQRVNSFGAPPQPQPQVLIPINKANYVKAHVKEIPMKPAAIALSWQLIDYESRKRKPYPTLFFDTSHNPRLSGFEIQVRRYGEARPGPMSRDEQTQLVSAHAWMSEMVIVSDKLRMWPIVARNTEGVRCCDVFRAIHDTLAVPLTPQEIQIWGPDYIERCKKWFLKRCQEGPHGYQYAYSRGICRVDLLRGKKYFKGLTAHPTKDNVWILHFEDFAPPGRV